MDSKEDENAPIAKEDEDAPINFINIKNLFKNEEEKVAGIETTNIANNAETNKDDIKKSNLSIDSDKIKNFLESKEKLTIFFKKYGIVLLALIPIILSIYIRMQGINLPFADEWARNTVIENIRSDIRASIYQQFLNVPDANKDVIAETELSKVLKERKKDVDATTAYYSKRFREFYQDESKKNYMPDTDPYYWVRYAENIIKNGHPGDELRDGRPFDNHQLAPNGRFVVPDMFHSYSIAYFYKLARIFSSKISVTQSSFYFPVVISAVCVLIVFLIGRKAGGNMGGFFAGLMMAVNAAFLSRTLFAHPDNDVWVVFFPIIITWLFVIANSARKTLNLFIAATLAGFFTGVYAFAWSGWWYIFDFLIATVAIIIVYLILANFSEIKSNPKLLLTNTYLRNDFIFAFVYFLSASVFAVLFSGWNAFRNSLLGPLGFSSIKAQVLSLSLWPNVLTTVEELEEGSLSTIINSMGGNFLFFVSLVGLILAVSREEKLKKFDVFYIIGAIVFYGILFINVGTKLDPRIVYQSLPLSALLVWIMLPIIIRMIYSLYEKDISYDFRLSILLSLWIASTIFASIKGLRFILLLAPPFSIAFGVAVGKLFYYFSRWHSKEMRIYKPIVSSVLLVIILLLYVNPIKGAIDVVSYDVPIINDAWHNALVAIKKDSKPNAIITSWWDFGHNFKYITDRAVTFDGTTQTFPPAHWTGKLLTTSNEKEAIGILKMLDCGSDSAYNELVGINKDIHLTISIINEIILLDKNQAEGRLRKYNLNEENIKKILSYTHCSPPEAYFIVSEDMVKKAKVWSHFGSWSFERADLWKNARVMPQEEAVTYITGKFNYTRESAENFYFEMKSIENEPDKIISDGLANRFIAPRPGYAGQMTCSKNEDGIYVCPPLSNGGNAPLVFNVNLSSYDIYSQLQNQIFRPASAVFATEIGLFTKIFNNEAIGHSMTVVPKSKEEVEVIISSGELSGSMFTRMFYMQGHGLKHFKLFKHEMGLTGTDIYVYKIDWEGSNATIVGKYSDFWKPEVAAAQPILENNSTVSNTSQ
ncbi:hypothetical protein HY637_03680 [Candidatus Woesearchaeota archaeon]|nr:hypothetical protein [Candidatus Woesearchaeota archaeon]